MHGEIQRRATRGYVLIGTLWQYERRHCAVAPSLPHFQPPVSGFGERNKAGVNSDARQGWAEDQSADMKNWSTIPVSRTNEGPAT